MRVQNPNVCNSFESLENVESTWEKQQGQLYVHRFRWPGCKNCVPRVGPYSTPADQRLNAEQTSLQICIPVSSSVEHRAREEKNSIDKPRRLEKPLVSHLALRETLRLKSKIMIRLRDFLSLHET
ncbi:hypothetical protein POM88_034310 [Heracleum sosnowskyi]|uniref:Uncharacterized protein n=1 Tax=Heracleum sosnowskyi TaxID=360622 RepID=A0AAD8HL09_9APIA|nr:hypothetical protein POM88_034310 [Heracleum sosnowskyi]